MKVHGRVGILTDKIVILQQQLEIHIGMCIKLEVTMTYVKTDIL